VVRQVGSSSSNNNNKVKGIERHNQREEEVGALGMFLLRFELLANHVVVVVVGQLPSFITSISHALCVACSLSVAACVLGSTKLLLCIVASHYNKYRSHCW
jgi:hypothetical protein